MTTSSTTTVQERIALPPAARPGGDDRMGVLTAADLYGMLRRRLVLIILLLVVFAALVVGGFAGWWTYLPGYRSECLIECISNIPETELSAEQERLRQEEYDRFVLTQAMLLKSPIILSEVLQLTAVRQTDWYTSVREGDHLLELTEELDATPVRGTNFLRVAMECHNKSDAQVIVGAVVDQWYNTIRRRSAEEFASKPLEAGQEELEDLQRKIADNRELLQSIAQQLAPGVRLNPANSMTSEQVREYAEQVAMLRLELSQLERYQAIYNNPEGVAVTAEDRALVEQDPQVAELSRALSLLEQQRIADAEKFGEQHSVIKQLDAQIAATDQKLAELRTEKLRERRADMREATNTAVDATGHALLLAQENLARAEAEMQDQDQLLFRYTTLEAQITQDEEYLLQLDTFIKGLGRVVRQQSAINANIAQPATMPLERSSPSLLLLPIGLFIAIALSMGIGLAVELMDKSVRTSQDIVRSLDIAMLGAVPHTDDEEVAIERVETAVRDTPRSMVAEAFRRIRTNLQFSAPAEGQRSILITSPRPGDGKTSVACNLAMAVSQGGRRVLLVDANLRRPGLHNVFSQIKGPGLSNLLVGEGALVSYVMKTESPALDLLGSGPVPPNPAELLGGEHCRAFLQEAMSKYDQVIIDTAPVLLASDSLVLSAAVDGVILVVRANLDSRGIARRAWRLLVDVNAHMFGAVLNAAQVTRGGYFREQLRTYYDYQSEVETRVPGKPLLREGPEADAPDDRQA
jgi:succinoglycan biosynthesis transport protein ExoP